MAKNTQPKASKASLATLFQGDDAVLNLTADKDGKVRMICKSWEDYRALLPGEVLELRRLGKQWLIQKREAKK